MPTQPNERRHWDATRCESHGAFLINQFITGYVKGKYACVCVCVSAHIDIGVFLYRKTWADSWFSWCLVFTHLLASHLKGPYSVVLSHWGLNSCRMWCCIAGWLVPSVVRHIQEDGMPFASLKNQKTSLFHLVDINYSGISLYLVSLPWNVLHHSY